MKVDSMWRKWILLGVIMFGLNSQLSAVPQPPVPTQPIYLLPDSIEPDAALHQQSCVQIDNAIRYLQPYRYSYKPGFYEDGYNTMAVSAIMLDFLPTNALLGLAYLGYSGLVEDKEQRRIVDVEQQIARLRQAKAEQHCFE